MLHSSTASGSATAAPPNTASRVCRIGEVVRWRAAASGVALVVDVARVAGTTMIVLAPGARCHRERMRPGAFQVSAPGDLRAAGLAKPIRFDLGQRIMVCAGHRLLASAPLGTLAPGALERMRAELGQMQALRPLAAGARERRGSGDHRRTGWRRASVPAATAKGGRA